MCKTIPPYIAALPALAACTKSDGSGDIDLASTLFLVSLALVLFLVWLYKSYREEQRKKALEIVKQLAQEAEDKLRQRSDDVWALVRRDFGEPDHQLPIDGSGLIHKQILVYEKAEVVFLDAMYYGFGDVLGFTVDDDVETVGGDVVEEVTTTDTGSMLGRAVLGDMIAGKAGAVIGGATAPRHTRYVRSEAVTYHDYTVRVNVDDLEEPNVELRIGDDEEKLHEVTALLNVIIGRKSPTKRKQLNERHEAVMAQLGKYSDECKGTVSQAFGQPDRVVAFDSTGLYDRQVAVYDRMGMFVYLDKPYMYYDVEGFHEEGDEVVVSMGGDSPATLRWNVAGPAKYKQETMAFLESVNRWNEKAKKKRTGKDGHPVVPGLTFTEDAGDGGVHVFYDTQHAKALVTFDNGSHTEQHVVDDFSEMLTGATLGRVWAADTVRRKALYAVKTPTAQRYDVYDLAKADANRDHPCPTYLGLPVCMGRAVIPSAKVEREAEETYKDEVPPSCLPIFTYVEERTACVTLFTDEGFAMLNYATPKEYQHKKKSCATIKPFGMYDIVADDFCKKLVVVSPLAAPLVLDYRDLIDVEVVEQCDTRRPSLVKAISVKVSTRDKEQPECDIAICYPDDQIDKSKERGKALYEDRMKDAEALKTLLTSYMV